MRMPQPRSKSISFRDCCLMRIQLRIIYCRIFWCAKIANVNSLRCEVDIHFENLRPLLRRVGRERLLSSPLHLDCEIVMRFCWWNFKYDDYEQIDPSCLANGVCSCPEILYCGILKLWSFWVFAGSSGNSLVWKCWRSKARPWSTIIWRKKIITMMCLLIHSFILLSFRIAVVCHAIKETIQSL